jgi:peroxiredoxin
MKHSLFLVSFLVLTLCSISQSDTLMAQTLKLIGKKVPAYQSTTIDGKQIDSSYFLGKVTILSFFGFGCAPCNQELSLLCEMSKTLPKENYQILLLGDATEKDLRDLRAYRSKDYGKMKRKLGIDTLAFDIVADCPENPVRLIMRSCKGSTETFHVCAFPTTFFINKKGIIKEICMGFALPRNKEFDAYFYSKLKEAENK